MKLLALLFAKAVIFPVQPDIYLDVVQGEVEKPWAFFAPHENEHVVNDYVKKKIKSQGGTFVILKQQGKRDIKLTINDKHYFVDPNRIFTDKGRRSTLNRLNPHLDRTSKAYQNALNRTEALAKFVMKTMKADKASAWIAIHNNTNGYDNDGHNGRGTISIKRYEKKLAAGANYLIQVNNAKIDEDDLFFITDKEDFNAMSKANWNVVLQNPEVASDPSEDDGSLSVLAEMQGKRYINVEAERKDSDGFGENHLVEQQKMVDLTFKLLSGK